MKLKPAVTMCFYINNEQDLDLFWHKIERQNIGFVEMSLIYHIISEYLYQLDKKVKSFLKQPINMDKNILTVEYVEDTKNNGHFIIKNKILILKLQNHLSKLGADIDATIKNSVAILKCKNSHALCQQKFINKLNDEHNKIKPIPQKQSICLTCNFIDFGNEININSEQVKTEISSTQFLDQIIEDKDSTYAIIGMQESLDIAQIAINKIVNDEIDNGYYATQITHEFRIFASNLSYFVEFNTIVDAIKNTFYHLENTNNSEYRGFVKIISALIDDLLEWVKIFTGEKRVIDIHYLDDSIISTLYQLELSLLKKAA